MRVKMPSGKHLKGKELAKFMNVKAVTEVKLANLPKAEKVAQRAKKLILAK
jgi:hypothetical protein